MKKMVRKGLVSLLIFVFSLAPISPDAFFMNISHVRAINIEDVDLGNIKERIIVPRGTKFVIEAGTLVNFANERANMEVEGELEINGTKDNPVIVKSTTFDYYSIITRPGSKVSIKNAEIIGGGFGLVLAEGIFNSAMASGNVGAIDINGGNVNISDTTFRDNEYAIITHDNSGGNVKVNYSKFINNKFDVEDYNQSDFTNNYWSNIRKTTNCANNHSIGSCFYSYRALGNFNFYPWQEDENFVHDEGASSVLFLPGVEASRLYEKLDMLGEYRLWEPRDRVEDLQRLYLDNEGKSVSDGIYTKDVVDSFFGIVGIYGGFVDYMNDLVKENIIKEWKPIPYDWRLPLEDIVDSGIKLENGEMNIIEELEKLAKNSNTGKVTIIGHSNGGLLGKVLIDRLKTAGKENLVDKFIMVATPQVGTPKAMAGLLHGDKLGIPMTMVNRSTARNLVENMSSAYNLLPSKKYFDYVQTSVVEFEDDVKDTYDFENIYGSKIDSKDELDKFLTGDDGKRSDPGFADTDSPNVVNENLLDKANNIHNNLLDNWQAPENMEVIQIAGWGLDTIAGIKYDDCEIVFCPDKLSNLDRGLVFKKDGDKTVVIPSAIIMNDGEIYYVDMDSYNDDNFINKDHASVMEVDSIQKFIKSILNNNIDLPNYITTVKPEVSDEDESLRYRMHSPVAVHLYDEDNNHTGLIENPNLNSDLTYYEENIPNSYYIEFGETKYLGSDNKNIKVELIGEDLGTFTFEIDELKGEGVDKSTTFKDIPVIKDMKARIDISENIGIMEIDWNDDDKIDATIDTEKTNSTEITSVQLLKEVIKSSRINPILKNHFLNEINVAEKQIKKGKNKVAAKVLEIVKNQIEIFSDKKMLNKLRIDKVEADNLIRIIETIRLNLIK